MANILIVHAHHEPKSFSSALARTAAETFAAAGHTVVFSDLYAMGFNPVSDRRNFTTTANAAYLKQQVEETHATKNHGFAPDVETEIQKLEVCDVLIFSFPLWWFGLPAILKGWVDRVFAQSRIYGRGQWYENGLGRGRKRGLVLMTTGGPATAYGANGLQTSLATMLAPIHHGIFGFNGFSALSPFVAWSAAHRTEDDRQALLQKLRLRLPQIFTEPVWQLPPAAEFDPQTLADTFPRFMVTAAAHGPWDDEAKQLYPQLMEQLQSLRQVGRLLSFHVSPSTATNWRGFFLFREPTETRVREICQNLPLAALLNFDIVSVDPAIGGV